MLERFKFSVDRVFRKVMSERSQQMAWFLGLLMLIVSQPAYALRNGTDISKDPYGSANKSVALLEADNANNRDYTFKCAAVAIAADMLLTAGHCLRGNKEHFRVRFVSQFDPLDYETVSVKAFKLHPATNGGFDDEMYKSFDLSVADLFHDIGVVLLDTPSNYASPMTLVSPDYNPQNAPDPSVFLFGRGRDALFRDKGNIEFARLEKMKPFSESGNIWTANAVKDPVEGLVSACVGDSGAPVTAVIEDEYIPGRRIHYLLGIFTFQSTRVLPKQLDKAKKIWEGFNNIPDCGIEIGYVNIQSEIAWIKAAMKELNPGSEGRLSVYGEAPGDASRQANLVHAPDVPHLGNEKGQQSARTQSAGGPFLNYPETALEGSLTAEISKSLEECDHLCTERSGCLGFDHQTGTNQCRLYGGVRSARQQSGSTAGTRNKLAGYRDPINSPRPPEQRQQSQPPVAEQLPRESRSFNRVENRDLGGFDFLTRPSNSVDQCENLCRGSGQCIGYTFNAWSQKCYLKSSLDALRLDARATSGILATVRHPGFNDASIIMEYYKDSTMSGSILGPMRTARNRSECESMCWANDSCIAFSFTAGKRQCALFDNADNRFKKRIGVESGSKIQPKH
ncbi:PAN domain-containing protein [Rhizobium sp. C4]|uniref:PAN domain-containing protein n=1 Tax=Rhizobium sp. C4 TaxID=1349800 RepID=UPI001E4D0E39|nr:PAN domain-containing protein [Rhizobium sp. C4]MCD2176106.1 PAN domain-containing protein [Rhizobium sp. C4]